MRTGNSSAAWLVVPGVRSTCTAGGAALVDPNVGHYYTLNGVAARVWVTIEGSPWGIATEDIVDVLETHFEGPRKELERDASDCLAELQLAGLAGEKVVAGDESSADPASPRHRAGRESTSLGMRGAEP